jgi:tryptophanyl-tRNA synthetase
VNNLLTIYQALTGQSSDVIEAHFAGKGYGALKKEVAEQVNETMRPVREKYQRLITEVDYLDSILSIGATHAAEVASKTLRTVQERVGFLSARKSG